MRKKIFSCVFLLVCILLTMNVGAYNWAKKNTIDKNTTIENQYAITLKDGKWVDGKPESSVLSSNSKIVVKKGKILTLQGCLLKIEGTLENHGTLILELDEHPEHGTYYANVLNSGVIINYGVIEVINGELRNTDGGTFTNEGTINISHTNETLCGIFNDCRTVEGNKKVYGTFINNGTINISNKEGYGIRNAKGASFENNGSIVQKDENAKITGKIQGNPIVMEYKSN